MDAKAKRRWYQFSLGRVFLCTFWCGVGFAVLAWLFRETRGENSGTDHAQLAVALSVILPPPFFGAGIGALKGRAIAGALLGEVIALGTTMLLSFIALFWALASS
jgi:hypothetical protein